MEDHGPMKKKKDHGPMKKKKVQDVVFGQKSPFKIKPRHTLQVKKSPKFKRCAVLQAVRLS